MTAARPIPLILRLDPARIWSWHRELARQLQPLSATPVTVMLADPGHPIASQVWRALDIEQAVNLGGHHEAFVPLSRSQIELPKVATAPSNAVVIDLAADPRATSDQTARTLVPHFDGLAGEAAMWRAVLAGRAPHLSVFDSYLSAARDIGQPAIETPHALAPSAAAVVVRLIEGLRHIASGQTSGADQDGASGRLARRSPGSWLLPAASAAFLMRKAAAKTQRLVLKVVGAPHWAVAWRKTAHHRPLTAGTTLDLTDYSVLPDDGQRYYADPFLIEHNGEVLCFLEEYPYATNRGLISLTTLRPDGTASTPQPVLETSHHLSYPQVFRHGTDVYMLPELHQSGALILYRAERFPDRWQPVGPLIEEPLHDATLFAHGGRHWIAANAQGPLGARWGSSWDALNLYYADTLLGPWQPHPGNPVVIGAELARPAGPVIAEDGALYRPVQNCGTGYGVAMNLMRIDRLDPAGFAQTQVARTTFAAAGLSGPHSLSRLTTPAGAYEAIDVFARPSLLRAGARPA
jgi:hypothetical protein